MRFGSTFGSVQFGSVILRLVPFALYDAAGVVRFTDEAARDRKKLDTEVEETEEMKAKRLEKAAREETIKEQVQVHDRVRHRASIVTRKRYVSYRYIALYHKT